MEIKNIPISNIVISEFNTRKDLESGTDDAGLNDLANSIEQHGLFNAITVRAKDDGQFEVIAGQRRFLACKQLELTRRGPTNGTRPPPVAPRRPPRQ